MSIENLTFNRNLIIHQAAEYKKGLNKLAIRDKEQAHIKLHQLMKSALYAISQDDKKVVL